MNNESAQCDPGRSVLAARGRLLFLGEEEKARDCARRILEMRLTRLQILSGTARRNALVLDIIRRRPGVTTTEIDGALRREGLGTGAALRAIHDLIERGVIREARGGSTRCWLPVEEP